MAKTWITRFPYVPGDKGDKHRSQPAAYRTVSRLREDWKAGALRSQHLAVYLDEGNGPQLFERIDLAEEIR